MPPVVQSLVAGAQVHPRAAAALGPAFVAEERAYTGARCELPTGEVVEVEGRKTPFFALCRELDKRLANSVPLWLRKGGRSV